MVCLHRGDDFQLPKSWNVAAAEVLGVFNAPAPIGLFRKTPERRVKQIEDFTVGPIADRVHAQLKVMLLAQQRRRPNARQRLNPQTGARQQVRVGCEEKRPVGTECPVLHHMGCAGNQSSRHVTSANTFEEADRIGTVLGKALLKACGELVFNPAPTLRVATRQVDPPRKAFPPVEEAAQNLAAARQRFEELTRTGPAAEARTAECDVFGAEQRHALASVAAAGELEPVYASCTPVHMQAIRVGDWKLIEWFEDGSLELYDLGTDPGEERDLARDEPDLARALRARLHEWRLEVDAKMPRNEETGE